ncbi:MULTISPECIES: tRNA (adenosine(37)-N6)-dimethylallyltransferase MiaA [unclassified Psychrobacter]|uniref:tRNA (adenosine(37)-N6)-dimethylallyltransferase MiaA n=2 Tax=Psychrobacter TaxID=497 RepID=UPI00293D2E84|nr:tRNA (adenosine(37)-N6)-dimethylallyltransferase MiaA [uncultured Psychrobacter sp.]
MSSSFSSSSSKLNDNSVICLMAPTASGKTALAYELYDTKRFELISVDSALIYRDMNIGTAKPTNEELTHYPHHLVNIIDPTQSYSVAEFVDDVAQLIARCHQHGKIPVLVGGTMMYYMALLEGLSDIPDSSDVTRAQVEKWRQDAGIKVLYEYLAKIDPVSHQRLKPNDTQRITRAIEIYEQTHIPLSEWQRKPKLALAHNEQQNWHALSVLPDRPWLHQRIAQRLDVMWNEGLVDEVIDLLERYTLTPDMPSMRCVGYRQVLEYLVHIKHPVFKLPHLDLELFYKTFAAQTDNASTQQAFAYKQMQDKSLYATRQLAKRQYTWLRKLTQLSTASALDKPDSLIQNQTFATMTQAREYLLS